MKIKTLSILTGVILILGLGACGEKAGQTPAPPPQAMPEDAVGYFCGMSVGAHHGPKGQVFLKGRAAPIWFVSVRDALAFMRLPDEAHRVNAVYVTDMAKADSWDDPGDGAWLRAEAVWFVTGSTASGGMGGSEMVPFGTWAAADEFVRENGGRVERLAGIETASLLGSDGLVLDGEEQ